MLPVESLLKAVSFAARAHQHQWRKDGLTPYAAHPMRVSMIVRHVFGVEDERILTAALLHDTIEDTTTDYEDIAEAFGPEVAGWVATLTKDMRLPEQEREAAYLRVLAAADWPVVVCKLADIFDNLTDSSALPAAKQQRTLTRSREYLDTLQTNLKHPLAERAFQLTAKLHAEQSRAV